METRLEEQVSSVFLFCLFRPPHRIDQWEEARIGLVEASTGKKSCSMGGGVLLSHAEYLFVFSCSKILTFLSLDPLCLLWSFSDRQWQLKIHLSKSDEATKPPFSSASSIEVKPMRQFFSSSSSWLKLLTHHFSVAFTQWVAKKNQWGRSLSSSSPFFSRMNNKSNQIDTYRCFCTDSDSADQRISFHRYFWSELVTKTTNWVWRQSSARSAFHSINERHWVNEANSFYPRDK